jgi:hypothetical protein
LNIGAKISKFGKIITKVISTYVCIFLVIYVCKILTFDKVSFRIISLPQRAVYAGVLFE